VSPSAALSVKQYQHLDPWTWSYKILCGTISLKIVWDFRSDKCNGHITWDIHAFRSASRRK
jgi:hypothetical protein